MDGVSTVPAIVRRANSRPRPNVSGVGGRSSAAYRICLPVSLVSMPQLQSSVAPTGTEASLSSAGIRGNVIALYAGQVQVTSRHADLSGIARSLGSATSAQTAIYRLSCQSPSPQRRIRIQYQWHRRKSHWDPFEIELIRHPSNPSTRRILRTYFSLRSSQPIRLIHLSGWFSLPKPVSSSRRTP